MTRRRLRDSSVKGANVGFKTSEGFAGSKSFSRGVGERRNAAKGSFPEATSASSIRGETTTTQAPRRTRASVNPSVWNPPATSTDKGCLEEDEAVWLRRFSAKAALRASAVR